MKPEQKDFYQRLRNQINSWIENKSGQQHKWKEYLLLAPDIFHLLCKLMADKDVPVSKKVKLGAVITYFISPLDFIPEAFFGPAGYIDDIALAAYVINNLLNDLDPHIVARHWAGEQDILNLIKTIVINADKMIGSGLWKKIKKYI